MQCWHFPFHYSGWVGNTLLFVWTNISYAGQKNLLQLKLKNSNSNSNSKTICKPGWAPYWGGWGFYNSFFRKGHLRRLEEDEDRVLGSNLSESADSMFQVPSLSSLCPLPVSVTQNLRQVGYHGDVGTKGPTPTHGIRVLMFKQDLSMTHEII